MTRYRLVFRRPVVDTDAMKQLLGSQLDDSAKREALSIFIYRYTGEHTPPHLLNRADKGNLQFKDDADWLAHTRFFVTKSGALSKRHKYCESSPTWPNNPELR